MNSHLKELQSYHNDEMIGMVIDASLTILFWRGHYEVSLAGRKEKLPLHSMVAFTWGVLVTNNYNRFVSFLLFSISWLFLATNERRRSNPSPWHRCRSYSDLLKSFLAGTCLGWIGSASTETKTIVANENLQAIEQATEASEAQKELKEQKLKEKEHAAKLAEIDSAEAAADALIAIATTKSEGLKTRFNPLKIFLEPIQQFLRDWCRKLRVVKSIVTWEENFYAFWITTSCFIASILLFFIPWGWVFRWLIRLIVWIFLGPWMKIVDWYFFEKTAHVSQEDQKEMLTEEINERYEKTLAERLQTQSQKEHQIKLRSMMKYLFGQVESISTTRRWNADSPLSPANLLCHLLSFTQVSS